MNSNPAPLKKNLGIVACILVLIHVLISILVMFSPRRITSSNFLTSYYRSLMVVGPFFYESQIKSSSHLEIRFYSNGAWSSSIEPRMDSFLEYQRMPFRFDLLRKNDFEEYLARQITSLKKKDFESVKASKAFRELNQYILGEYAESPPDSVSIVNFHKMHSPRSSVITSTIFSYTYNPHEIAPAKR